MSTREQVLDRLEEIDMKHVDNPGNEWCRTGHKSIEACDVAQILAALRAIIEAHECRETMRMRPGGGEGVVHECRADCPVALAAHHLGIES